MKTRISLLPRIALACVGVGGLALAFILLITKLAATESVSATPEPPTSAPLPSVTPISPPLTMHIYFTASSGGKPFAVLTTGSTSRPFPIISATNMLDDSDGRPDAHDLLTQGKQESKTTLPISNTKIRCETSAVWFLPVRDHQFKITVGFGYHGPDTPYFTQLKAHDLVGKTVTQGVFHPGLDLQTGYNAPIFAVAAGRVVTVAYSDLLGKHIVIEVAIDTHTNTDTQQVVYGHLADTFVVTDQLITCGQVIGISGASGKSIIGAHLHFEVRYNGKSVDPTPYLETSAQAHLPDWTGRGKSENIGFAHLGRP